MSYQKGTAGAGDGNGPARSGVPLAGLPLGRKAVGRQVKSGATKGGRRQVRTGLFLSALVIAGGSAFT